MSVGGKALFAGGRTGSMVSNRVDIYDDATRTWSTATLSIARYDMAATSVGPYALFAGGSVSPMVESDVVDVFDSQTSTWSTTQLSFARTLMAATTVGSKAMFAGGGNWATLTTTALVDVYDASLGPPSNPAAWSLASLTQPRAYVAAVTVGSHALFAGGTDSVNLFDRIDVYDDSTGLWSTAALSEARVLNVEAATTAGPRAFFAGGVLTTSVPYVPSGKVDIYDSTLGAPDNPAAWSSALLSVPRGELAAASLGNTVLFVGGRVPGAFVPTDAIDAFDAGTGQWSSATSLRRKAFGIGSATVGGRVLFAGGSSGQGQPSADVDVFEPLGIKYCAALTNSTGARASIDATGNASLASNQVELRAVGLPSSTFLFFWGASQVQIPFGNGLLCTGGGIRRIGPVGTVAGGVAQRAVDLPMAGITTPGTRNFQCWFRDAAGGGAGTNTTDAIAITFVP